MVPVPVSCVDAGENRLYYITIHVNNCATVTRHEGLSGLCFL